MAADFNKPVTTDNYVDLLGMLRDNQEVLARMFAAGVAATNIPIGSVRFDSGKFQTWSGSAWVDVPVSIDGGGTGAQSAADARVALGTHNAENLTTGVMSADRVPGLDASKLVSGTLTLNTTGNAATATHASSAGSAGSAPWSGVTGKPAFIGAGATELAARQAIGAEGGDLLPVWVGSATSVNLSALAGGFPGDGTYIVNFGSDRGQIFLKEGASAQNVSRVLTIANPTPATSSMSFYTIRYNGTNIFVDENKIAGDGPTYTRTEKEMYQIWRVV